MRSLSPQSAAPACVALKSRLTCANASALSSPANTAGICLDPLSGRVSGACGVIPRSVLQEWFEGGFQPPSVIWVIKLDHVSLEVVISGLGHFER